MRALDGEKNSHLSAPGLLAGAESSGMSSPAKRSKKPSSSPSKVVHALLLVLCARMSS